MQKIDQKSRKKMSEKRRRLTKTMEKAVKNYQKFSNYLLKIISKCREFIEILEKLMKDVKIDI